MGCVHKAEKEVRKFAQPIEDVAVDAAAVALAPVTGGLSVDAIPALNAGISAANGGSLSQDLTAGAEALAGQELAGAVGFGQGNPAFNDALGITDTPAGFGLPDISASFNSALGSVSDTLGLSSPSSDSVVATNDAGAGVNAQGTTVAAPATTASTAPSSGAPVSAGTVGDIGASQIDTQIAGGTSVPSSSVGQTFNGTSVPGETNLGNVASNAIGATPSQGLALGQPDTFSGFASGAGGANIPGAVDNFGGAFTPASASSGGIGSTIKDTAIKAALPLGALAYEAIKGPAQLPGAATALGPGGSATAPLSALETQGATEATTGQLTPTQQANVLQYVQQSQNALLTQLAQQGVTDPKQDSRYVAGLQQIQQQALAMQQQYITAAISEATSAGGAASQNIATVANEQIQNDTAYQDALAQAFAAIGGAAGGGGLTIQPRAA